MPIYEYKCKKCGYIFEKIKSVKDIDKKEICPKCNSEAIRIISNIGNIIFKGDGFYETDYKKKK